MNFKELESKKFLNISVLYWGLGIIASGIALYAWKLKATPDTTSSDTTSGTNPDGTTAADDSAGSSAAAFDAFGTGDDSSQLVTSSPPSDVTNPSPTSATPANNEAWSVAAINYLVAQGTPPLTAQAAITAYLNGSNLTYDQGQLINEVEKNTSIGTPPEALPGIGQVASAPAQRQGTPPTTHTIKGSNDNDYTKLATLYYGSIGDKNNSNIDLLQAHNLTLGKSGPFPVGTKVSIPALTQPKLYTTTATMTAAQIAAKNGTSAAAIEALNDRTFPVKKGTQVRVA